MQQLIEESLEKEFSQSDYPINKTSSTCSNNNACSNSPNSIEDQFILNSPIIDSPNYLFSPSEKSDCEDFQDLFLEKKISEEIPINENKKEEKLVEKTENKSKNIFKCDFCTKTYLSQAALYTHCKNKHNVIRKILTKNGKTRGRPRKEEIPIDEKIYYDPNTIGYFLKDSRVGTVEEEDFEKCIKDAFEKLYVNKKDEKFGKIIKSNYENLKQVAFLKKFSENSHDKYKIIVNENENIDNVFIGYLNRVSLYCSPDYFTIIVCFISLFRNFIDYKKNQKNETEFSEENKNEVEDVPFLTNEFINIFFSEKESDNFIELSSNEAIELMQNFCYWLYENNYTTAKLSLNSNDCEN